MIARECVGHLPWALSEPRSLPDDVGVDGTGL